MQRTVAGEVSDTVPSVAAPIPASGSDDGTGRVMQLWVLLGAATVIVAMLLAAVTLNREVRGEPR